MRRTLSRPTDPDQFGRLIAALRVYTGERLPANATEQKINDAIRAQSIPMEIAKGFIHTLDSTPTATRKSLLGEIASPAFVPTEGAPQVVAPVNVSVPATAFRRLPDDTSISIVGIRDAQGPGPYPKPVYTIRYQGLFCNDETSWDRFTSSDEIYVVTTALHIDDHGQNIVRTEGHPAGQGSVGYYGDVDKSEARLGPVGACWFQNSNIPLVSLTVVVFEHDEGDPKYYKDQVDMLVKAAAVILVALGLGSTTLIAALVPIVSAGVTWLLGSGDDPIETQTVVLPQPVLEAYAAQWQAPYIRGQVVTNLYYHFLTTHSGGGANYTVAFDVLREPELERPVILV